MDFDRNDAAAWNGIGLKIQDTVMSNTNDDFKDTCTQLDAAWRLRVHILCELFGVKSAFENSSEGDPSSAWELRFDRDKWNYHEIEAFLVGALEWDMHPAPAQPGRPFTLVSVFRDGDQQWVARQFWGYDI